MILQHFLFGPSDHLPYERRMIRMAPGDAAPGAPEELKPTSDVSIDVNSKEFKALQAKLLKQGLYIGSLADHRMEDTRRVVDAGFAPKPGMHPYGDRCCPPAIEHHPCMAEPACAPGFTPVFERAATEARVRGHCHDAAERRCYDMGRLPSAPAREPRAGDRRVWPDKDGSVGYQVFTMDKGWVWSTDYNPARNPNRWKGIKMKDPPASMMGSRDTGRHSGGGDRRGGFGVYRSDDAERTTYATGVDRPNYRPPLSSYSAKDRQTEKILRESETPLSRAEARANQASFDQIAAAGAAGRSQGSAERLRKTEKSDLNSMSSLLNREFPDTFKVGNHEVISSNGRVSVQLATHTGEDSVNVRKYLLYVRGKFQGEFFSKEEVRNALLTGRMNEDEPSKNASRLAEGTSDFRPRRPGLKQKETLPTTPATPKNPDAEAVPPQGNAPERSFVLPPDVTPENSTVIPSGVSYIMFRQPDGNVRMLKYNGTDAWTPINAENAKFMKENGIRTYVETYQEDGRTLQRHHIHFTKPGRYEVGTKDPQQRDLWYAPKNVKEVM